MRGDGKGPVIDILILFKDAKNFLRDVNLLLFTVQVYTNSTQIDIRKHIDLKKF